MGNPRGLLVIGSDRELDARASEFYEIKEGRSVLRIFGDAEGMENRRRIKTVYEEDCIGVVQ